MDTLVEYVLFHPGPWSFRTASGRSPAHRIIDLDGREAIFSGGVVLSPDRIVELCADDRMVSIAAVDDPSGEQITWKIALNPVRVS